jgi:hypothetical protein
MERVFEITLTVSAPTEHDVQGLIADIAQDIPDCETLHESSWREIDPIIFHMNDNWDGMDS